MAVRKIINDILNDRYGLPPLEVGVGLGMSKAIISLVGLSGDLQEVKAFGKCVFNATKLSNSRNEVKIDTYLKAKWPSSKNGSLKFEPKSLMSGDHRVKVFLIKYPISD